MKRHFLTVVRGVAGLSGWFAVPLSIIAAPEKPGPSAVVLRSADNQQNPILAALQDGFAYFSSGQYALAVERLEFAIQQAGPDLPDPENVYFYRATAHYSTGDYARTLTASDEFLQKFPGSSRAGTIHFARAQALFFQGRYEPALAAYRQVEGQSSLREAVSLGQALCLEKLGRLPEAVVLGERAITGGIVSPPILLLALKLISWYGAGGQPEKAAALLRACQNYPQIEDFMAAFNTALLQAGDELLEQGASAEALLLFRFVRTRSQLLRIQEKVRVTLQKRMDLLLARNAGDQPNPLALTELKQQLEAAKKLTDEILAIEDYDAQLYFRIGTASWRSGAKWQAVVAFDEIIRRFPESTVRSRAWISLLQVLNDLGHFRRLQKEAVAFATAYPQDTHLDLAIYLHGAALAQMEDLVGARAVFTAAIERFPHSVYRDQFILLAGNCSFELGSYAEARLYYERYGREFPEGVSAEEAIHRTGLSYFLEDDYERARAAFCLGLKKYADGVYAADAKFRLATMDYSEGDNTGTIKICRQWAKDYPTDDLLPEVLALEGDAQAAENQVEEAVAAYRAAIRAARSEDTLHYSLPQLRALLQRHRRWGKMISAMEEFIAFWPTSSLVVDAHLAIAQARAKTGEREAARAYLTARLQETICDPSTEAAERYLLDLLGYLKPSRSVELVKPEDPPQVPLSLEDELEKILAPLAALDSPTVRARLDFTRAQLAMRLKKSAAAKELYASILKHSRPSDLSPPLLAMIGEAMLEDNRGEQARALFRQIVEYAAGSNFTDVAWRGLGELAFREKEYAAALEYFGRAADPLGSGNRLKEAGLGKARCLLALGQQHAEAGQEREAVQRLKEAGEQCDLILSTRAWRGEAYAESLWCKAQAEEILAGLADEDRLRQQHLEASVIYCQRIFIAYQKYPDWMARAYLQAGELLERLGKPGEALLYYQEMLANPRLKGHPSLELTRAKISRVAPSGQ